VLAPSGQVVVGHNAILGIECLFDKSKGAHDGSVPDNWWVHTPYQVARKVCVLHTKVNDTKYELDSPMV
jgi:hypothetical protein